METLEAKKVLWQTGEQNEHTDISKVSEVQS